MASAHQRPLAFLGGMTAAQFMREYWQQKPLLVRDAYRPAWIDRERVFELAAQDDIEARLVTHFHGNWRVRYGPSMSCRAKNVFGHSLCKGSTCMTGPQPNFSNRLNSCRIGDSMT